MKVFLVSLVLIVFSNTSRAQEVMPLRNIKDVEAVKESNKGKVVLVNFWATWCLPCVEEFPELIKLYKNYKKDNFRIIFISVDVPEDIETKVKPFLKKKGASFKSYYSDFEDVKDLIDYFDKKWGGEIPATYIFDKKGKLTSILDGKKNYNEFETEIKKDLD